MSWGSPSRWRCAIESCTRTVSASLSLTVLPPIGMHNKASPHHPKSNQHLSKNKLSLAPIQMSMMSSGKMRWSFCIATRTNILICLFLSFGLILFVCVCVYACVCVHACVCACMCVCACLLVCFELLFLPRVKFRLSSDQFSLCIFFIVLLEVRRSLSLCPNASVFFEVSGTVLRPFSLCTKAVYLKSGLSSVFPPKLLSCLEWGLLSLSTKILSSILFLKWGLCSLKRGLCRVKWGLSTWSEVCLDWSDVCLVWSEDCLAEVMSVLFEVMSVLFEVRTV